MNSFRDNQYSADAAPPACRPHPRQMGCGASKVKKAAGVGKPSEDDVDAQEEQDRSVKSLAGLHQEPRKKEEAGYHQRGAKGDANRGGR